MRRILLAALCALSLLPAHAGAVTCASAGGILNLPVPRAGDIGSAWASCLTQAIVKLSSGNFTSLGFSEISVSTIAAANGSGIYFSSAPVIFSGEADFQNSGSAVFSIKTSSGISVSAGMVTAPWFVGALRGNADTATGFQSVPTIAPSGYLSRGVDVSGNAHLAWVETNVSGVSGSTAPWSAGAAFTALAAKATDSSVVHLAGSETITGFKNFSAQATFSATPLMTATGAYGLVTSSGAHIGSTLDVDGTVEAKNSGANAFSIVTASGVKVGAGGIQWPDGSISTTAAIQGGGGSGTISAISTATVSAGQLSNVYDVTGGTRIAFYNSQADVSKDTTTGSFLVSIKNLASTPPTQTVLNSGSGTYTVPSGVIYLHIRMVGGGGGGGGVQGSALNGGNANSTYITGVSTATGGFGGAANNATDHAAGGAGGSGGAGIGTSFPGGGGGQGTNLASASGQNGGSSCFGGSGLGGTGAGGAGGAGTGGGGAGGFVTTGSSAGSGGAGECKELTITSPLSSYTYSVSTGAAGGTGTAAGGNGGSGRIIIDEYYQGIGYSVPASSEAPSGNSAFSISNQTSFQSVTGAASTTTITGSAVAVDVTCGWSRTGGVFGSSLFGQIVRDNGAETFTLPTIGAGTASQQTNITGNNNGHHLFTGLSAGTHVFQLQVETGSGADTWQVAGQCKVSAEEHKNAAGTGDACTNCNQTFSGSNAFTGPVALSSSQISGIPGSIVGSTMSVSGSTWAYISGLNGNVDGAWTIEIDGTSIGTDGAQFLMQPNGDTTLNDYRNTCLEDYSANTTRFQSFSGDLFAREAGTATNSHHLVIHMRARTLSSMRRGYTSGDGWSESSNTYEGYTYCGGAWNDTTSNITSLLFQFGDASTKFTGNIIVKVE